MQIAVIEYARYVCGLSDANSGEFDEDSKHKVIDFMPDQSNEIAKGGTMRLGAYPCRIIPGTKMEECYKTTDISERHRHRYEFNNDYRGTLTAAGLRISGMSPDGYIVETVEVPENSFYVGVQFHPEFKSRPNRAHPLFLGLIESCARSLRQINRTPRTACAAESRATGAAQPDSRINAAKRDPVLRHYFTSGAGAFFVFFLDAVAHVW